MPHQWMEGNLPVSSKCFVCEKTCGSVLRYLHPSFTQLIKFNKYQNEDIILRLQDWRCLWCKATVHTACRPTISNRCPLGPSKLSVVPPTALHSIGTHVVCSYYKLYDLCVDNLYINVQIKLL